MYVLRRTRRTGIARTAARIAAAASLGVRSGWPAISGANQAPLNEAPRTELVPLASRFSLQFSVLSSGAMKAGWLGRQRPCGIVSIFRCTLCRILSISAQFGRPAVPDQNSTEFDRNRHDARAKTDSLPHAPSRQPGKGYRRPLAPSARGRADRLHLDRSSGTIRALHGARPRHVVRHGLAHHRRLAVEHRREAVDDGLRGGIVHLGKHHETVVRSTSVQTEERLPAPLIRSPSQ